MLFRAGRRHQELQDKTPQGTRPPGRKSLKILAAIAATAGLVGATPAMAGGKPGSGNASAAAAGSAATSTTAAAAALATPLELSAVRYIEFRGDVAAVEISEMSGPSVMRDIHHRLASHDPSTLSSGWVAYAALVAADTPEFAASIQERIATPEQKEAFLEQMRLDPRSLRNLSGADEALDAVMQMAASDASKINEVGQIYMDRGYSMQNVGWAKQKLSEGMSRVYAAREFASTRQPTMTTALPASLEAGVQRPGLSDTVEEWQASWAAVEAVPAINPRATPIMDRVLVLAARYSVGGLNERMVEVYAKSDQSRRCLNMAKLMFDQCMAATRTAYEEAFCIGKHGLNDVSGCVGWVAGAGDTSR